MSVVSKSYGSPGVPIDDHGALLGLLIRRTHRRQKRHRHEVTVPRRLVEVGDPLDG